MIKLSIITINYNNREGLERTMDSVFMQSFRDFEYIIIDGGSNDGSGHLIAERQAKLGYWISEKDAGIYAAMNKGIKVATGEYLLFLNSGDELYEPGSLADVVSGLKADIVYGNLLITNRNNETGLAVYPARPDFAFFVKLSLPHSGSFIKRQLFDTVGLYDESLKIIADWKFFLDAFCKFKCSYQYIDKIIAKFFEDGVSSKPENREAILSERENVLQQYYAREMNEYRYLCDKEIKRDRVYSFSTLLKKFKFLRK